MRRATLLIYAKPPLMGVAKTRLAAGLGRAQARRIARFTMARTIRAAIDPRWQTQLYAAPDRHLQAALGGLWPQDLSRVSQGRGDLTARLEKGLRDAPNGPVLFIGSDAPGITSALIWQAIRSLTHNGAVFGPASDGGFWLFGLMKGPRTPSPFRGVRWSGPHALSDVRANLSNGTNVALLLELIDIDDARDWRNWNAIHN